MKATSTAAPAPRSPAAVGAAPAPAGPAPAPPFADNRPAAVAQRRLQAQASHAPRTRQQQARQEATDASPRLQQAPAVGPSAGAPGEVAQLMPRYGRMMLGGMAGLALGTLAGVAAPGLLLAGLGGAALGSLLGGNEEAAEDPVPPVAAGPDHGRAEDRLERMRQRGQARRDRSRIDTGQLDTPTGPTTVSGLFRQRMTQANRNNYGGETFGSIPYYNDVVPQIPPAALPALADRHAPLPALNDRQRLATSLAYTLGHVSEEDRAPGTSSYLRAMTRDYVRTGGTGAHPLSVANFPARSTAPEQVNLMEGRTPLSAQQRRALEEDSGESSDEDAPHFVNRA